MRERGCYGDYLTKTYDEDYFVKSGQELSVSRIERTISLLGEVTAKPILDLGCGTGEGSVLLRNRRASVVCVDVAIYAVYTCHRKGFDGVVAVAHCSPFKIAFLMEYFLWVLLNIPLKNW